MFNKVKLFSIMLVISLGVTCCNEKKQELTKPIYYQSPNQIYQRDSLYIATTVWQFMDKEVDIFDYYKRYKIPFDEICVVVDSIIYSPDSLKLFSFVIIGLPDYEGKYPSQLEYSGDDLIGFRSSKKEPWSIWYFGEYRPSGYDSYNKVRNLFRWYYLGDGKFKNDFREYWNGKRNDTLGMARSLTFPKEDNRVNVKFGYNLDDKRFWDSSIVWKKGSRIPGYYAFQTKGNVAPGYMDEPIKLIPPLDYPDSLLKLFK